MVILRVRNYITFENMHIYSQWRQTGLTITSANGAGRRVLWNKMNQHKGPLYYIFGAGQKTTSAVALMDWSVWRH